MESLGENSGPGTRPGGRTEKQARVIAWLGKGGTGKTALSALTAKIMMADPEKKILMIDADPAMGLVVALGLTDPRTVGGVRRKIIREARQPEGPGRLSMMFDYLLMEALREFPGFSLLVMGAEEGPGCYCPLNTLLRESIEQLAESFDLIVIDAEAGIEQVSRQVTRRVDYPLIATDSSLRGVVTAEAIARALARFGHSRPAGVIFNRVDSPGPGIEERLAGSGIPCLGTVPHDDAILEADREGRSLLEVPADSAAASALARILTSAGITDARD